MTAPEMKIKSIGERLAEYERALTAEEVAALFGTHQDTIRKQARCGDIPSFRIGSSIRFDPKKLCEWLDRQTIDLHGEIEKLRKVRNGKR